MADTEQAREREATDDANEAARNTEADSDATGGVLDQDSQGPLPGDADEAVRKMRSDG
jgi:hypothetical protein